MEFHLESFELSGLKHDGKLRGAHQPRDYQLKIIADDGLAFNSTWFANIAFSLHSFGVIIIHTHTITGK